MYVCVCVCVCVCARVCMCAEISDGNKQTNRSFREFLHQCAYDNQITSSKKLLLLC